MDKTASLYSVLLYVQALDASLEFYRDRLGLRQLYPPDESTVMLEAGGSRVVLHRADRADWPDPEVETSPGGHALTFEVDDPDAWAQRLLREGVEILAGPLDQIWGRVLFTKDPDGRVVALAKPAQ